MLLGEHSSSCSHSGATYSICCMVVETISLPIRKRNSKNDSDFQLKPNKRLAVSQGSIRPLGLV